MNLLMDAGRRLGARLFPGSGQRMTISQHEGPTAVMANLLLLQDWEDYKAGAVIQATEPYISNLIAEGIAEFAEEQLKAPCS